MSDAASFFFFNLKSRRTASGAKKRNGWPPVVDGARVTSPPVRLIGPIRATKRAQFNQQAEPVFISFAFFCVYVLFSYFDRRRVIAAAIKRPRLNNRNQLEKKKKNVHREFPFTSLEIKNINRITWTT